MSRGDVFVLQSEATTNTKREQGAEGGKKREHADDGMIAAPKLYAFSAFWSFEQGQRSPMQSDYPKAVIVLGALFHPIWFKKTLASTIVSVNPESQYCGITARK